MRRSGANGPAQQPAGVANRKALKTFPSCVLFRAPRIERDAALPLQICTIRPEKLVNLLKSERVETILFAEIAHHCMECGVFPISIHVEAFLRIRFVAVSIL